MIKKIINGIISLIISLVNIILLPIDNLITQYIPSLSNAFSLINNLFSMLGNVFPWVVSYLGISSATLSLIVDLIVFRFTVPYLIHSVKLAIKWYNALKV